MNNNKKNKDNNYEICWIQICPYYIIKGDNEIKLYRPDRDKFPYRLCVLNIETEKFIDVKTKHEYDYIQTSLMYFLNHAYQKIENGKRYGILKLDTSYKVIEEKDMKLANNIIIRLKKGEKFPSGNDISNDDYLSLINSETLKEEKNDIKVKSKSKIKRK